MARATIHSGDPRFANIVNHALCPHFEPMLLCRSKRNHNCVLAQDKSITAVEIVDMGTFSEAVADVSPETCASHAAKDVCFARVSV